MDKADLKDFRVGKFVLHIGIGGLQFINQTDFNRLLPVPDFTGGAWKTNRPLEIVDVDPALLPLQTPVGAK